jgi:hypothetical protein
MDGNGDPHGDYSPCGDRDGKKALPVSSSGDGGRGISLPAGAGMGSRPPTGNSPLSSLLWLDHAPSWLKEVTDLSVFLLGFVWIGSKLYLDFFEKRNYTLPNFGIFRSSSKLLFQLTPIFRRVDRSHKLRPVPLAY